MALDFPLRLERAQLRKVPAREAYMELLRVMAQTPAGSWQACTGFGFREKLEELQQMVAQDLGTEEQRAAIGETLVAGMNGSLRELGLHAYEVDRIEVHWPTRDVQGLARAQWAAHIFDDFAAVLILRPATANRLEGPSL